MDLLAGFVGVLIVAGTAAAWWHVWRARSLGRGQSVDAAVIAGHGHRARIAFVVAMAGVVFAVAASWR